MPRKVYNSWETTNATGFRTCPKCECTKPLSEFTTAPSQNGGHYAWCNPCHGEQARKWRNRTPHPCIHCGEPATEARKVCESARKRTRVCVRSLSRN